MLDLFDFISITRSYHCYIFLGIAAEHYGSSFKLVDPFI